MKKHLDTLTLEGGDYGELYDGAEMEVSPFLMEMKENDRLFLFRDGDKLILERRRPKSERRRAAAKELIDIIKRDYPDFNFRFTRPAARTILCTAIDACEPLANLYGHATAEPNDRFETCVGKAISMARAVGLGGYANLYRKIIYG